MGKKIKILYKSNHVVVDRAARIAIIEKCCGWGKQIVSAPDKMGKDVNAILTTTGVIIIKSFDGMMITAWIASVPQAIAVWKRAKGNTPFPSWLWSRVNYNNNTEWWRNAIAG